MCGRVCLSVRHLAAQFYGRMVKAARCVDHRIAVGDECGSCRVHSLDSSLLLNVYVVVNMEAVGCFH